MNTKNEIKRAVCSKDCPGHCGLLLHCQDGELIKVMGEPDNPTSLGLLCAKGRNYPEYLNKKNRLLYPMKKVRGGEKDTFKQISWEEAYQMTCEQLSHCKERYGTESVLHYQGAGDFGMLSFEYAQGFWKQYGPITRTSGSLCDVAGATAIRYTYGDMKQNSRDDLANAKLIIIWGKNPQFTDIHSMKWINQALKKGAKLVVIDPRRSESAAKADLHIVTRAGTDGLLALGVARLLKDRGLLNQGFLDEHVYGAEQYLEYLDSLSLEDISDRTDVSLEQMQTLVDFVEKQPYYALVCGSGLQRYRNGGQTIRAIACLPPLTGSIGMSGAGLYYSDNQSRSLTWPYTVTSENESGREIPVTLLASTIAIQKEPKIHFVWIEKANPLVSNPNSEILRRALKKIDFKVVVDLFMTDTAREADLVLPAASLFEKNDLLTSYGTGYVQLQENIIEPMGESKDECLIYQELAERLEMNMSYLPQDFRGIVDKIIERNQLQTSYEELKDGAYWHETYQRIAYKDLIFKTPSGKIELYCEKLARDWQVDPLPLFDATEHRHEGIEKYPLQLLSYHAKNSINSQTMVSSVDVERLRIHPADAKDRGLEDKVDVIVYNDLGSFQCPVDITEAVKQGLVTIPFGEDREKGSLINVLVMDQLTDMGQGAVFHNSRVEVKKSK